MVRVLAALTFSLLACLPASAMDDSILDAVHAPASSAIVAQVSPEEMGDGLAAERAELAAGLDAWAALEVEAAPLVVVEADEIGLAEPTATGALGLAAWEAEEPTLVQAYVMGREAFEATLTP